MPRSWGIRLSAGIFILLALYLGYRAFEYPAGGGTFPLFSTGGVVLLSALLIATSFDPRLRSERISFDVSFARLKPLLLAVLTFVYVIAMFHLGYFVTSAAFLVLAALLVGLRNYRTILVTAVILFPAMYGFFVVFLHAQLPTGILI